jgi:hypothetical protein
MDEWFFMREKYRNPSVQNHKWLQSAKNYRCICCVFDVPAYIAERINTAFNMRETLVDDSEKFLKYPEARKIALAAKGTK